MKLTLEQGHVRQPRGQTKAELLRDDDTVKLLLSNGANVRITNRDGDSALSLANEKGHVGTVELLRKAEAK